MFTAEETRTSDDKGRVSVPSELRAVLQKKYAGEDTFIVTPALRGKCLWAFPPAELEKVAERIQTLGLSSETLVRLRRRLFAKGRSCTVDKAGRINIPDSLREMAGIGKDVLFAGAGHHIELWNPALYESTDDQLTDGDYEILGKLGM